MLHGLLGVGDYDDSGDVLWFKFRMTEIAKIKALRRKRRISIDEFAQAARFCYRRRIPVRHTWEVCGFIDAAKKEARKSQPSAVAQTIEVALANERSRPDTDEQWVARLLRARGPARSEVLKEWVKARG